MPTNDEMAEASLKALTWGINRILSAPDIYSRMADIELLDAAKDATIQCQLAERVLARINNEVRHREERKLHNSLANEMMRVARGPHF